MARYIDIEGAGIGKANRERFLVPEYADGWNAVLKILEKEPTADVVEVKHGEWIKRSYIVFDDVIKEGYHCSVCQTTWDVNTKYCPNCGAEMDGGRKNDGKS